MPAYKLCWADYEKQLLGAFVTALSVEAQSC